jgi:general secretion pathway protein K
VIGAGETISNRKGSALIFVIWVMIFLSVIGLEFSYSMRTEANITRTFLDGTQAYYAALAGIEQGKAEIKTSTGPMFLDETGLLVLNEKDVPGRSGRVGQAVYAYGIVDEERKLNLNRANQPQLVSLFQYAGIDGERLNIIVDSILDWKDSDDTPRLNGAEESYYRSLPFPRSAKDGFFDTVEELLLVRGISADLILGATSGGREGLASLLTTKGGGEINVNTAERPVLEAVYGTTKADEIINGRRTGPITAMAGGVVKSAYFTIMSTGRSNNVQRTIKAIVVKTDGDTLKAVYWNDNWVS